MSEAIENLSRSDRAALAKHFDEGGALDVPDVAGWDFRGFNCSLAPRLGGFQKFVKGFYRDGRQAMGFNAPVIQNGVDGEWLALPADDDPKRFGFYTVDPDQASKGLLLDYGRPQRNPRLDPSRLLRDVLVRVGNDPDLLIGKAHLALGTWVFAGYFLLERRRPHDFTG